LIERAASQVSSIGRKGQLPRLIYTSLDLMLLRWTGKAIVLYIHVVCTHFQTLSFSSSATWILLGNMYTTTQISHIVHFHILLLPQPLLDVRFLEFWSFHGLFEELRIGRLMTTENQVERRTHRYELHAGYPGTRRKEF